MSDQLTNDAPEVEPEEFGVEPDPADPAYNADPDDVHGAHDHPAAAS